MATPFLFLTFCLILAAVIMGLRDQFIAKLPAPSKMTMTVFCSAVISLLLACISIAL